MIFEENMPPRSKKYDFQKLLFWRVLCPQRTSQIDPLVLGFIWVEFGTAETLWDPSFEHFWSENFPENLIFLDPFTRSAASVTGIRRRRLPISRCRRAHSEMHVN